MKTIVLLAWVIAIAGHCAALCPSTWTPIQGQCMICSANIAGATNPDTYTNAADACVAARGNLTTIVNSQQENFVNDCDPAADDTPWIGYHNEPLQHFLDGTKYIDFGNVDNIPDTGASENDCFYLDTLGKWNVPTGSPTCDSPPRPFVCSRPYITCPDLESTSVIEITYTKPTTLGDTHPTIPAGTQCLGTVATYSCPGGYQLTGTNTRTCQMDTSWSGSPLKCAHTGICGALVEPDNVGIQYSDGAATNGKYVIKTIALQTCDEGYDMKSGSLLRVCQANATWSNDPAVCEANNNALALGLGLGLGAAGLLVVAGLICYVCCRHRVVPSPPRAPYPAPAYPRPVPRPMRRRFRRRYRPRAFMYKVATRTRDEQVFHVVKLN